VPLGGPDGAAMARGEAKCVMHAMHQNACATSHCALPTIDAHMMTSPPVINLPLATKMLPSARFESAARRWSTVL